MVRNKKSLWLGLGCGLMIAAVLVWVAFRDKTPSKSPSPVNSQEPKIELNLDTVYKYCNHSETKRKTVKIFRWAQFEGWRLERQTGSSITLLREEPSLCPICLIEEFMGVHQGKVVIYYGRPGRAGPVKESLAIKAHELPEAELHDLERGIVVHDAKEKLQLLEGLSSLSDG